MLLSRVISPKTSYKRITKSTCFQGWTFYSVQHDFEIKTPDFTRDAPTDIPKKVTVSKEEALQLFRQMTVIRKIESSCAALYKTRAIRGFCHLYAGQEAVCVGIKAALKPEDYVITSYRAHGWTHLMGVPIYNLMAELLGRKDGCSQGKGGSMHTFGPNFFGGNGIVGAQAPLGTGLALSQKYRNTKGVTVTLYGDGAANQGQVYEAFNMAKLWNLPSLYVCENNIYGMGTSSSRSSANTDYYKQSVFLPGIRFDGMDVITTREVTKVALEYARTKGPIVLEASTYRYFGHSMSDPGQSYRSRDEVKQVRTTRDPITKFKQALIDFKLSNEEELKKIDSEVKKQVVEDTQKALKSEFPPLNHLGANIVANVVATDARSISPLKPPIKRILVKKN